MNTIDPKIKTWSDYKKVYQFSLEHPDEFWSAVAKKKISWRKPWTQVSNCDYKTGKVRWFQGAELNVSENCLDRHLKLEGGKKQALIWVGNTPQEHRSYTFRELHQEVCRMANVLEKLGIKKGSRVVMYLPNIPELAISVLACARIGAVHSVIFGGFSAHSIHSRTNDCQAELIITAMGTYRGTKWIDLKSNVDESLRLGCPSVKKVIVLERDTDLNHGKTSLGVKKTGHESPAQVYPDEVSWNSLMHSEVSTAHEAPAHSANDPLFILYTSGSTGKPKGVLHQMGGYLTYAAYSHEIVFQPKKDDIYWCTADMGWITGHTYLLYGPLANGITTVMFEGIPTYPDAGRFWDVVDQLKVNIFYTSPTAIRTLASAGDEFVKRSSRKSLRVLGSVGEPINPEAWKWYNEQVGGGRAPIVDTWWQTETGGILISPLAGITPTKPGCATLPLPGIEPRVLNPQGEALEGPATGPLVIARSWPGQMTEVYGDPSRFFDTYFKQYSGYYFTGDGCNRDEDGYFWLTGRMDDVIKVSGHRLGTAEIESALITHKAVVESAAIGVADAMTGESLQVFVVLKDLKWASPELEKELIAVIRSEVGALAHPKKVFLVPGLPKTRSGKIMRRILRKIAEGDFENLGDTSTLSEPGVVEAIVKVVRGKAS